MSCAARIIALLHRRGHCQPRRYAVHGDTVVAHFHGEGAGKTDEAALRGDVVRLSHNSFEDGRRSNVDDATQPRLFINGSRELTIRNAPVS